MVPPEKANVFGNGARLSFQFKYEVPVETPYLQLADHQLLLMHHISQLFFTLLISSFYQSIEFKDAHANLLTESTVTLNYLCNFTSVGKELSIG